MADIKGYTLSYCPWCKRAKRFFAERDIPIDCVDYDLVSKEEQQVIEAEMKALSGGDVTFPCVIINGEAVMGYHPDRYLVLLGLTK